MKQYLLLLLSVWSTCVWAEYPTISASQVTMQTCQTTYGSASVALFEGDTWHGKTFSKTGDYVVCISNAQGCDSLVNLHVKVLSGALPGKFSISATEQVYFSQGNLQYCAAPSYEPTTHAVQGGSREQGIWRFAPNQWNMCGADCKTKTSPTYGGWIDYFGYGTSGYQGYMPYEMSENTSNYPTQNITGTNYDWGIYNAISNGGDQPGLWFCPSIADWQYIINSRANAASLRSAAVVHNTNGVVLLPDDWIKPDDVVFSTNQTTYSNNILSNENWEKMEKAGAVFLPTTSSRDQTAAGGRYWGTTISSNMVEHLRWSDSNGKLSYSFTNTYYTYGGYCVRLVQYTK